MGIPYSIALRAESDDPWSPDVHSLDVYTLNPSTDYDVKSSPPFHHPNDPSQDSMDNIDGFTKSPYSFPPIHQTSYASIRGFLRCPDIYLGTFGTAIWIQARPARNVSLTDFDVHSSETQGSQLALHRPKESLVGALFRRDGPRSHRQGSTSEPRVLCVQESDSGSWSSLDYDEVRGRIAMGSGDGKVTLLELWCVVTKWYLSYACDEWSLFLYFRWLTYLVVFWSYSGASLRSESHRMACPNYQAVMASRRICH